MTDRAFDDDVELPEQEGEAAAPAAGPRWKKLAILVGAPVLALALIAGGLFATGVAQKMLGLGAKHEEPAPAPKKAVFYDLPEMLVNLSGGGRKTSFLKLSI